MTNVLPMSKKAMKTKKSLSQKGVESAIDLYPPHPERIQALRRWHIEQATCEDAPVAAMHVMVTASCKIQSTALAIEPAHAAAMLPALTEALRQVQEFAAKYYTDHPLEQPETSSNVVMLRKV